MKPCPITVWILFIAITAAGCGSSRHNQAVVENVDGVIRVHNIDEPKYPDKTVEFEEELVIGNPDRDSGDAMLYQPVRFAVSSSNEIYIIDRQDWTIKVFDSRGEYLRSLGGKGRGPGEFLMISEIDFLDDGRLLALDPAARRASFFSPRGDYLMSHACRERFTRLLLTTPSSYWTDVFVMVESQEASQSRSLVLKEYDFKGEEVKMVEGFQSPDVMLITQGDQRASALIPHAPESIFAGDPVGKRIYHCRNDRYMIEAYDGGGRLILVFDRPYDKVPFTDADAEACRKDVLRYGNSDLDKRLAAELPMPDEKSVTQWMVVDDRGFLWIKTFEKRSENGRTLTAYDIFDPQGIYDARVWIRFEDDFFYARFYDGRLHLMETNPDTGFRVFKRYRVRWTTTK